MPALGAPAGETVGTGEAPETLACRRCMNLRPITREPGARTPPAAGCELEDIVCDATSLARECMQRSHFYNFGQVFREKRAITMQALVERVISSGTLESEVL